MLEEEKSTLQLTADHVKDYLKTSAQIVKLQLIEKSAIGISHAVSGVIMAVVFFFVIVFASIGAAMWLSNELQSNWAGFLIVAGFYLLLGIIVSVAKYSIIVNPFSGMLIKQMLKEDSND